EILALDNGKLSFVDTEVGRAVPKLAKTLVNGRHATGKDVNFITVIYGEDVTEEEAEQVCDGIRAQVGDDVDMSAIAGGQPVYYYFLSVE
ncbi:MAG: DAK2 domain-containing protein, partial [Clostridia bacterium]|nr:DAK2 domain-containing protein [Clostridia bacterium]